MSFEVTEISPGLEPQSQSVEPPAEEIIVTGTRLKLPAFGSEATLHFASYTPAAFASFNLAGGSGGPAQKMTVQIVKTDGGLIIKIPEFNITITISPEDWSMFTKGQQDVMMYVFQNYSNSPDLQNALQHLENQGVTSIEIHIGDKYVGRDGILREFPLGSPGNPADAVVDYGWDPNDPSKTTITDSRIVISFNINEVTNKSLDVFARNVIHELMHPWVPDTLQPDGSYDDHPALRDNLDAIATNAVYQGGSAYDVPSSDAGVATLGSYSADYAPGTYNDDLLAGMEGDDHLDGFSGNDVLFGGLGNDYLKAGVGTSHLHGGVGNDTYAMEVVGANLIEDTGGVDQLRVNGNHNQFSYTRAGDDLVLYLENHGDTLDYHVVKGQFTQSGRIETFVFNNGTFEAGYIDSLAGQDGGGGDGDGPPYTVDPPIGAFVRDDVADGGVLYFQESAPLASETIVIA